jgi:hypothetical protein
MTLRDRFDKLNTHYVKGLTNLNHQKNLEFYARDLVAHYAKYDKYSGMYNLFLCDISDSDQNELARLYIDYTDRELNECVHGNDFSIDNEYTCALLAMLKDNTLENRERFAEITRNNIINYYKKSLQKVIDTACEDYLMSMYNENDMYSYIDQSSGDVMTSKY